MAFGLLFSTRFSAVLLLRFKLLFRWFRWTVLDVLESVRAAVLEALGGGLGAVFRSVLRYIWGCMKA